MVDRRVLAQLADESDYATTQRELQMLIQSNDVFKVEGKFSIDRYKDLLRLNGISDVEYERIQTEGLTQNQIKHNF
jgi:peptidyl-prolyl cis-trans isomerase D